jgi:hypothetical protein
VSSTSQPRGPEQGKALLRSSIRMSLYTTDP